MNFQSRDILTNHDGSVFFRVYRKGIDVTYTYDLLDADAALPVPEATSSIQSRMASGELVQWECVSDRTVTPKMLAHAKKGFSRIAAATQDDLLLLSETGRAAALKMLQANDPKLTAKTFYKYIRLYFACGGVPNGMLPQFDRCGHKGIDLRGIAEMSLAEAKAQCQEQSIQLQKLNPRHKDELIWELEDGLPRERRDAISATLYQCDRATLRVFLDYYRRLKGEGKKNLTTLLMALHDEVFSTKLNGKVAVWNQQCIPSMHQFKRWYKRLHSYGEQRAHRKTDSELAKTERARISDERTRAIAAGNIGAGDATIFNVSILNSFPTADVIGPPVVFRIRCESTGMLLGLSVSIRSASYDGFAKAINNCLEDKVAFCAKYGIHITEEDWPTRGLPGAIHADCGETDNSKINPFLDATGIRLTNLWAGRPDFRGGNESDWNTLQLSMMPETPGACLRKWYEYQPGPPWQTGAELTIHKFIQLLLLYELARMKKPRPTVKLTSEEIAAGVNTSPLSMWNWCVANRGGGLRRFDSQEVQLSLLEHGKCSITPHGLEFQQLTYLPAKMISSDIFARAARRGRTATQCAYDDNLCDQVYLLPEVEGGPVVLYEINTKLASQQDFKGKSFTEIKRLFAQRDKNNAAQDAISWAAAVQTRSDANAISDQARAENVGAPGKQKSPARQIREMAAHREAEKNRYQPTTAFQPFVDPKPAPEEDNVHSIIEKSRKKNRDSTFMELAASLAEPSPDSADIGGAQ